MNWVGGSRNRIIFKQERQKQKEFFERKKLKSKLKLLKSASPKKTLLSLDLLNLYVINQISNKKEKNKKPQHVDICKETFFGGRDNGELPMSPITVPSKICLDDSEIISSQMPTIECRMNPDTLNYQSNQVSNNEDKRDLTNEANRRIDFNTKFTKKTIDKKTLNRSRK
ncbi:regulator of DNA class I crossover intermediates 1 isoform X2 [Mixophyes fleayi]|uniref:regulator of DNA class I crossover intermediates 1 isoform X2 n=1 Tax=Mixophyes fleayi TaxID=3061075 RepID=UPI003F4E1171